VAAVTPRSFGTGARRGASDRGGSIRRAAFVTTKAGSSLVRDDQGRGRRGLTSLLGELGRR